MFGKKAASPNDDDFAMAEKMARDFRTLFLPVYLALLCLEPRPWYTTIDTDVCENQDIIRKVTGVLDRNDVKPKLTELVGQEWLKCKVVDTSGFLDVSQWIGLLSATVKEKN